MAFKDTDRTVFVGRNEDGSIYGVWTNRQWDGQEEILEDETEVQVFRNRSLPKRISDGELAAILVRQNVISQSVVDAATAPTQDADFVATK